MISKKNTTFVLLTFIVITISLYTVEKRLVFYNNKSFGMISYKVDKDKYLSKFTGNTINIYLENGKLYSQYELKDELILSNAVADLDNDGKDEIILLTCKDTSQYAEYLLVLSFNAYNESKDTITFKEIYRHNFKDLNPWKVQTSDVDGDGKTEISIGVYKTSPLHPVMAKRPFVYDWINSSIFPKWRGSRLSRPFDDYVFLDLDSDERDEIVSIEHTAEGKKVLTAYSWKGFGFEKTGESISFLDISSISVKLDQGEKTSLVKAKVKQNSKWLEKTFYYLDGEILTK